VIANWKLCAAVAGICFVIGFGFGWYEKTLRIPALLEEQKTADIEQCNLEKNITRKANDQLQTDRKRVSSDLARYKRMHAVSCVIPSSPSQLQPDRGKHAGGNGAVAGTSDQFREFASRCESYRVELLSCIDFLTVERKAR
jgi:hypothetical protein